MFGVAKEVAVLILVPILLVVVWSAWLRSISAVLPFWRNGIVVVALLIISLHWMLAVAIDLTELLHHPPLVFADMTWVIYHLSRPLEVTALICVLALKDVARLEAALASLVMLVCWPGGYS
jgi:hypothetical protein